MIWQSFSVRRFYNEIASPIFSLLRELNWSKTATISMFAVESLQETAVMSTKHAANLARTIYYVIGGSR